MYVKFNSENKSETCLLCPTEDYDLTGFEKCDDALMGNRLVKEGKVIRAMTEEELTAERLELAKAKESISSV